MKRIATLILLMTCSIPGFARNKDSVTVHFPTSIMIGSKEVPDGDYKMAWAGAGPQLQVTFSLGGKVLVTMPATLASADNTKDVISPEDPVIVTSQSGKATVLNKVELQRLTFSFGAAAQ